MLDAQDLGPSTRTKRLITAAVLGYSALLAFWFLTDRPLENHEAFVSVSARNMVESGNWIVPNFNGQPRLKKTPLPYWAVAGLSKITGHIDEFTARLPSALAGIITAAAILFFANQWFGFRAAVLAALIFSSTLSFAYYTHSGRPEMDMAVFTAIAMMAFYSATIAKTRKEQVIYALLFWVNFSLANLAKGPAPLPLVVAPIVAYIVVFKEYKLIGKMLPIIGPLVFLLIFMPWPLAIVFSEPNWMQIWKFEYVDRFVGETGRSNRPFYYYLPASFELFAPWVAFLALALTAPFFKIWDTKRRAMWFLWIWFVADVVIMSLATGKRRHYILPVVPALAILAGVIFEDLAFVLKSYAKDFAHNLLVGHLAVFAAIFIAGPLAVYYKKPELLHTTVVICSIGIVWVLAMTLAFKYKGVVLGSATTFAGMGLLIMLLNTITIGPNNIDSVAKNTAIMLREEFGPQANLKAYRYIAPKFIHYFGKTVPSTDDANDVRKWYDAGDYIVADFGNLEGLDALNMNVYCKVKNFKFDRKALKAANIYHKPQPGDPCTPKQLDANADNPVLKHATVELQDF